MPPIKVKSLLKYLRKNKKRILLQTENSNRQTKLKILFDLFFYKSCTPDILRN